MKLKKEIEYYLRQLVFGLAIDSNPNCFKTEKQEIPILLNDFKLFNEKITQIGIEYPLIHDSKIWEFKQLAKRENVSSEEVLQIIDILMAEWLPNYDIDFRSIKTFTQRDPMVLGILLLDIQTEALKDMLRFMAVPGITESELEEAVKQAVYEHSLHLHEKRITIIENLRKAFTPQQEEILPYGNFLTSKAEKLKINLTRHGFYQLNKVEVLNAPNQSKLLNMIEQNGTPYTMAMFEVLGYIKYLDTNYFNRNKTKRNREIGSWLGVSTDTIKNNINSLSENSKVDRSRYTAFQHTDEALKQYDKLKG